MNFEMDDSERMSATSKRFNIVANDGDSQKNSSLNLNSPHKQPEPVDLVAERPKQLELEPVLKHKFNKDTSPYGFKI